LTNLVVGGAGFMGSYFTENLITTGSGRTIIVDNFNTGSRENLKSVLAGNSDSILVNCDATNYNSLFGIVTKYKVDKIFNFATNSLPSSLEFPAWNIENNINLAVNACELVRYGHVEELINISTSEVYGTGKSSSMNEFHPTYPLTPYAASKLSADKIVESYISAFGINATTLRPFNNIGPRQNFNEYAGVVPLTLKRIKNNLPIIVHGDGNQTRDFIYVKETIKCMEILLSTKNYQKEVYNIGTGIETSILDLIKLILKVVGQNDYPIKFQSPRTGDILKHKADVDKFKSFTGYAPSTLNLDNISETVEWYIKNI
jgi:UDP-glucose 4-epimerase